MEGRVGGRADRVSGGTAPYLVTPDDRVAVECGHDRCDDCGAHPSRPCHGPSDCPGYMVIPAGRIVALLEAGGLRWEGDGFVRDTKRRAALPRSPA